MVSLFCFDDVGAVCMIADPSCTMNKIGQGCCSGENQGTCMELGGAPYCQTSISTPTPTPTPNPNSGGVCMFAGCTAERIGQNCCNSNNIQGTCMELGGMPYCQASGSNSNTNPTNNSTNSPNPDPGSNPNPDPNGSGAGSSSTQFSNPLEFDTVEEFLGRVLSTIRGIVVVLSIIFIVLGGIFYITSAGSEKRMTVAKGAIFASMIGLAIAIAAPSFLKEIASIIGWNSSNSELSLAPSLTQIALNFLNFLLSITGALALIMLIVGGIMYLTSAGDDDRIKTGKKIVTYSIIGIAICLASLVIVKQVANLLR